MLIKENRKHSVSPGSGKRMIYNKMIGSSLTSLISPKNSTHTERPIYFGDIFEATPKLANNSKAGATSSVKKLLNFKCEPNFPEIKKTLSKQNQENLNEILIQTQETKAFNRMQNFIGNINLRSLNIKAMNLKDRDHIHSVINDLEKGLPDILKSDYSFKHFGEVGQRKELLEMNRWIESILKWTRLQDLTNEYKLEIKQFCLKKSSEILIKFIARDNKEKSIILNKIWSELIISFQEYIDHLYEETEERSKKQIKNTSSKSFSDSCDEEHAQIITFKNELISKLEKELNALNLEKKKLENRVKFLEENIKDNEQLIPNKVIQPGPSIVAKKELRSSQTDTSDLLEMRDKSTLTFFNKEALKTSSAQTHLSEFIEKAEDLPLTPIKQYRSPQIVFKEFMDFIEETKPLAPEKMQIPNLNQHVPLFSWDNENNPSKKNQNELIFEDNEFKNFYIDGGFSVKKILNKFEEKAEDFFSCIQSLVFHLTNNISSTTSICEIEDIGLKLERIRKTAEDFLNIIEIRDQDNYIHLMKLKAKAFDLQLELNENVFVNRNWESRFNQLFKMYSAQKELLTMNEGEKQLKREMKSMQGNNFGSLIQNNFETFSPESSEARTPFAKDANTFSGMAGLSPKHKNFQATSFNRSNKSLKLVSTNELTKSKDPGSVDSKNESKYSRKSTLVVTAPILFYSSKMKIMNIVDTQAGQNAIKFMKKLKASSIKPEDILGSEVIFRLIPSLYGEVFKNESRKFSDKPFYFYFYDYILARYGSNSIKQTESKLIEIIATCLFYEDNPRIRMLLRMITVLSDPFEFEPSDMNKYFEFMAGLDDDKTLKSNSQLGLSLLMCYEKSCYIPYKIAYEYCAKMGKFQNFNQILIDLREPSPTHKGQWIINVDFLVEKFFLNSFNQQKNLFYSAFGAVDYKDENSINFEGFSLWFKVCANNIFAEGELKNTFEQEADLLDEKSEQKYLSLKKFLGFAERSGHYSDELQSKFLEKTIDDIHNLTELEKVWSGKRILIKIKYSYSSNYTPLLKQMSD